MTDQGERIAILETRMEAIEKDTADTAALVRDMHSKMNVSKGAIWGAMAVLSSLVGFVGWLLSGALHQITDLFTTRPHP